MKPINGILSKMKARCDAATPEPWQNPVNSPSITQGSTLVLLNLQTCFDGKTLRFNKSDAEFISHARTDLPRALKAIEELVGLLFKWTDTDENESVNTDLERILAILEGKE